MRDIGPIFLPGIVLPTLKVTLLLLGWSKCLFPMGRFPVQIPGQGCVFLNNILFY